jgi:hypothetical protein
MVYPLCANETQRVIKTVFDQLGEALVNIGLFCIPSKIILSCIITNDDVIIFG